MVNAISDALSTATRQLATEQAAVNKLAAMGLEESRDMRFARSEVVRLEALVARLSQKVNGRG